MKWESCDSANSPCTVNLQWILHLFVDFAHSALLFLGLLLFHSASAAVASFYSRIYDLWSKTSYRISRSSILHSKYFERFFFSEFETKIYIDDIINVY